MKEILAKIKKEKVEIIELRFTDLAGVHREVGYPARLAEKMFREGVDFDGSSVTGFCTIGEGSLSVLPVPETLKIDSLSEIRSAAFICDVINPQKKDYLDSPRSILKRAVKEVENAGYKAKIGVEYEYMFLKVEGEKIVIPEKADYAEYHYSLDGVQKEIVKTAVEMGLGVDSFIHEHGPSMYEIHSLPKDPLSMADEAIMMKDLIVKIAEKNYLRACFMAKPFSDLPGLGFHTHFSLWDRKLSKNLFYGGKGKLSKIGESFLSGILDHAKGLSLLIAPHFNSYKRLSDGYEAPTYITWGYDNRSTMCRIAPFETNARLEFRAPDISCDPYLAFAGCLMAGLDGVRKKSKPQYFISGSAYDLEAEEIKRKNIERLPKDLKEAAGEFEKDKVLFGFFRKTAEKYVKIKREEWEKEMSKVWPHERKSYFLGNVFLN